MSTCDICNQQETEENPVGRVDYCGIETFACLECQEGKKRIADITKHPIGCYCSSCEDKDV